MSRSILVFSYFSNMPGACQAEWVDDRMFAFIRKGYDITLISATCCFTHTDPHIKQIKTPALSPNAGGYEYDEIHRRNIPVRKGIAYYYTALLSRIQHVMNKLNLRSGEGRWSWFITSFIAAFFKGKARKHEFIFTTGGPASGHLAGILLSKMYGKKVICEFQDPLTGEDIGRNKLSKIGLAFFERVIIRYADHTIYCTKNAMLYARKKYAKYAGKIDYVYPGSNAVEDHLKTAHAPLAVASQDGKINITYLGSLYQTRNLDTLMQAIGEMINERTPGIDRIAINVYGNMNPDIRQRIIAFDHPGIIQLHGLVSRDEAMQKALEADVLLLVQNKDERSVATIPFKTYDYLHTGRLIFGMIYRNDEIEQMLSGHGHLVCQADDVEGVKNALRKIIQHQNNTNAGIRISNYTPDFAVTRMMELIGVAS